MPTSSFVNIWRRIKKERWAYVFIAPGTILFLVFRLWPAINTFWLSMMDFSIRGNTWIGLTNFIDIFNDPIFYKSLQNTVVLTAAIVILDLCISLFLAILIYPLSKISQVIFKCAFYFPSIASAVVVALIWTWLFEPRFGIFNYMLSIFDIQGFDWLGNPNLALWALIFKEAITGRGISLVVLLTSMDNIPESLYESAKIDGANGLKQFMYVTLPLIRPGILYVVLMTTIYTFRIFAPIHIMTRGGPFYATTTLVYRIYNVGFGRFEFGMAAALGVIVFFVLGITSFIQHRVMDSGYEM
ncbi:MAG TPA: sugar ABC transporter permease [Erysipelothrix sp.]|nr:sugar ABC transporter permease [Erysipelothrix sp.]